MIHRIRYTYVIKIIFFAQLFVFLLQSKAFCQSDAIVFIDTPEKFIIPNQQVDLGMKEFKSSGNPWVVYSERQYNKSYTNPNGNDVKQILDNYSPYYVSEYKNKHLHLFKKADSAKNYEDYGWVHMDNLLLWNHCLVSSNNMNLKVILNNSNKNITNQDISDSSLLFNIFYIYKIQNGSFLIGRAPRFMNEPGGIQKCIVSWIPSGDLWIWDQNGVLEPAICNTNITDNKCIPENICLYETRKEAKKSMKNSNEQESISCLPRSASFWNAQTLRFPLISIKDNIAELLYFSNIYNKNNLTNSNFQTVYSPTIYQNEANIILVKKLLFTAEELARISSVLSDILKSNDFLSRTELYANLLELSKNEFYLLSEAEIENLELDGVHNYLFNNTQDLLKKDNILLKDINNPQIVSDSLINKYTANLRQSLKSLMYIINDNSYKNQFRSNGILYYYIDESLFPKHISQL